MKLVCNSKDLSKALRKVFTVAKNGKDGSIISQCLLNASGETLTITATDFESTMIATLPCDVQSEGIASVKCETLTSIAGNAKDESTTIGMNGPNLIVVNGKSKFKLATMPAEDFAKITFDICDSLDFDKATLSDAFNKSAYATSGDHSRPNLQGVYFTVESDDNALVATVVATDGHRLSCHSFYPEILDDGPVVTGNAIIHSKSIASVKSLLGDNGTVAVSFSERNLVFSDSSTTFVVRPIEEKYPEYKQVLPKDEQYVVGFSANRKELIDAIKSVTSVGDGASTAMKIAATPDSLTVSYRATSIDNEGKTELDHTDYMGGDVTVAINFKYALEALNSLNSELVTISAIDPMQAVRIVPANDDDTTCILMPLRS